jgi:predicted nucleotidyltransferase
MGSTLFMMNLSHPLQLISHPLDGLILEVLAGADAAFTGRQVHALVGEHSVRGIQLGLNRLRGQGIIKAEPAGRAILYRFNTCHLAAAHVLGLAHLRHELVRRLKAEFERWDPQPTTAYLFGSTARRESTAPSDLDIFVVRPRNVEDPDRPDWREQIDRLSERATSWTGNDTRVLEYAENDARASIERDPVLRSIREGGIQLAGDERFLRTGDAARNRV